jgi:formamidopyrimidine-DNA glycosylase
MPELPDITIYVEALQQRIVGETLKSVRIASPFLLRTFEPQAESAIGRQVTAVDHIGKRIVLTFAPAGADEPPLHYVLHLMIAGRLRWTKPNAKPPGKIGLAAFGFESGTLLLTEASQKKRAALHVVQGDDALTQFDAGGLDVLNADVAAFAGALRRERHTLKRSLTDPRLFCGIGNAYSDEILHAAGLSPILRTDRLTDAQIDRLYHATRDTLQHWIAALRAEFAGRFPGPGDITAFRPDFAVHGKFDQPCPTCAAPVQRIRYAENETNYCPKCQTDGKILADRSLSRLLKDDWPRTLEELEGS